MKVVSYNVNGIRAALKKGFDDWILKNQFDIVCVQETKAHKDQVDLSKLSAAGFDDFWFSAEKKGYSGVAIFSKVKALNVQKGIGHRLFDGEGRVMEIDFPNFKLINAYFPSGTTGDVRQAIKMEFLEAIQIYANERRKRHKHTIVLGDYNIAHEEIDIHNPKGNKNNSGFLPEERAWVSAFLESGWVDAFRFHHPDLVEYSWWTYRANARANNKGWRIDYQCVSPALAKSIVHAKHYTEDIHSDHCGLMVEYDL